MKAQDRYNISKPPITFRIDSDTRNKLLKLLDIELTHIKKEERNMNKLIIKIIDEWILNKGYAEQIKNWNI